MKDFVKNYGSVIIWIIVVLYYFVIGQESDRSLMFDTPQQKSEVVTHVDDSNIHMPMSEKIEVFVPRTELDSKFESIIKSLERIEKKL